LKNLIEKYRSKQVEFTQEKWDHLYMLYGEVEELIHRIDGVREITVNGRGGSSIHKDYISAGFLSGRTFHTDQAYSQLLKVIGKVRALAESSVIPEFPISVSSLVSTLNKFRECCQYIQVPPKNERDVQDILWIILRSHFDRLDREETLPKFGVKSYRPDFGIPDLGILLEVKFIGEKTHLPSIQEGILADIPAYLAKFSKYTGIIAFVYDANHKLRDPRKFIEDIRTVEGIVDVIVVPGI
jgi:hypothetical protein